MRYQFILTVTNYCTWWTKVIAIKRETFEVVIDFLEEHILTQFSTPYSLVCDNGPGFNLEKLSDWASTHNITITYSTNYYPQGNGLVENTNNNLLIVLKKLLENKLRHWHIKLKYVLWAYQIRIKNAFGMSPFQLVYGAKTYLPSITQDQYITVDQGFHRNRQYVRIPTGAIDTTRKEKRIWFS